jgi:hypothetical protein
MSIRNFALATIVAIAGCLPKETPVLCSSDAECGAGDQCEVATGLCKPQAPKPTYAFGVAAAFDCPFSIDINTLTPDTAAALKQQHVIPQGFDIEDSSTWSLLQASGYGLAGLTLSSGVTALAFEELGAWDEVALSTSCDLTMVFAPAGGNQPDRWLAKLALGLFDGATEVSRLTVQLDLDATTTDFPSTAQGVLEVADVKNRLKPRALATDGTITFNSVQNLTVGTRLKGNLDLQMFSIRDVGGVEGGSCKVASACVARDDCYGLEQTSIDCRLGYCVPTQSTGEGFCSAPCNSADDCGAPEDPRGYCVLQPGEVDGYCIQACTDLDAQDLGCDAGLTCIDNGTRSPKMCIDPCVVDPGACIAVVTGVTALGGDRNITVSWSAVASATQYYVAVDEYADLSTASWFVVDATYTSANITTDDYPGLTNGTTYYVAVEATDGVQVTDLSKIVSVVPVAGGGTPGGGTPGGGTPGGTCSAGQVCNVIATAHDGVVVLTWDAIASATSYKVVWATGAAPTAGAADYTEVATNRAAVGGLTNGTTYQFAVEATASGSPGPLSAAVTGKPAAGTKVLQETFELSSSTVASWTQVDLSSGAGTGSWAFGTSAGISSQPSSFNTRFAYAPSPAGGSIWRQLLSPSIHLGADPIISFRYYLQGGDGVTSFDVVIDDGSASSTVITAECTALYSGVADVAGCYVPELANKTVQLGLELYDTSGLAAWLVDDVVVQ